MIRHSGLLFCASLYIQNSE